MSITIVTTGFEQRSKKEVMPDNEETTTTPDNKEPATAPAVEPKKGKRSKKKAAKKAAKKEAPVVSKGPKGEDWRGRYDRAREYVTAELESIDASEKGFDTEQYRVFGKAMEAFLRACRRSAKLPWE